MDNLAAAEAEEPLGFSLSLTALQVLVYFTFLLTSCFAADSLRATVPGTGLPASFVAGLLVIACGTLLTVIYVRRIDASASGEKK
ncbi:MULTISPECIES: DUF485 domain-containing protein [Cupriavidus]